MKKIGFTNFRRFKDFGPIEYGGITFLVGRNNAGKSTLVKALLLIDNYFKAKDIFHFSFDNSVLEDVNVVTYGRAKHQNSDENFIEFTFHFENNLVEIKITGEDDNSFGVVNELKVTDFGENLKYIFNIQNKNLTVNHFKDNNFTPGDSWVRKVHEKRILDIKKQIESNTLKKTSKEYIELVSTLDRLEKTKKADSSSIVFSLEEDFGGAVKLEEIVERLVVISKNRYEREFRDIQNNNKASKDFKDLRAFYEFDPDLVTFTFQSFIDSMNGFSLSYLGANAGKQSSLFNIRDKNNALAQAIHDFVQLNIEPGQKEYRFVQKWMKEFEIGNDFEITMHAGEAYEMRITSNDSKIQLADKGMGSIQAMLLIMRIACVIKRYGLVAVRKYNFLNEDAHTQDFWPRSVGNNIIDLPPTIIIEEPELNLHPALQSKLADLFHEVYAEYGMHLLVETHSEYILRKSQVIVAENELAVAPNDNPFCVHYFGNDYGQSPYQLKYQADGTFDKNFGDGFFDTASLDTLKLLRIKREKKA